MPTRLLAVWMLLAVAFLAAVPASAQGWTEYRSEAGRFRVVLPGAPQEKSDPVTEGPAAPGTNHIVSAIANRQVFLVAYSDYRPDFTFDSTAELNANRDNFVKGIEANLLTTGPATTSGITGIEITAEKPGQFFVRGRIFNRGKRPYMIAVMVPFDQRTAPEIARFLDSFAFTGN